MLPLLNIFHVLLWNNVIPLVLVFSFLLIFGPHMLSCDNVDMCKYCCALCIHIFLYAEQSFYMLLAFFPPDLAIIIYTLRLINNYKLNDLGVGGGSHLFGRVWSVCVLLFVWEICSSRKSKHRDDFSDLEYLCSLINPVFSIYGGILCVI